jgi:hypothetical protein
VGNTPGSKKKPGLGPPIARAMGKEVKSSGRKEKRSDDRI